MRKGVIWLVVVTVGLMAAILIWIGVVMEMPNNEELELTVDQRNVLLFAGVPQDRLDDRALLPSEMRLLEWLAQAQEFMAKRYPQEQFAFIGVDNTSSRRESCFLHAVSASAPERTFTVKVTEERCTESYYAIVKQAEMEEIVREAFAQAGVEAGLELTINSLYGLEFDPAEPLKQTLADGRLLSVGGFVYVQAADLEALQQHLGKTLRAAGLCGGFALCQVKDATLEEVLARTGSNKAYVAREVYVRLPAEASEVK